MTGFNFDMLFDVFPNLSYLHMGSGAWKEIENYFHSRDMALVIHKGVDNSTAGGLISKCRAACPRVRWKRGMWTEGTEDLWVSEPL
ncbi:hypothetical protein CMV_030451 [Castanea mollissima]|uniref:Uncharacterized protein n=1 Tax=Castanea mollissima TaxID=60419 RepID=A0A8J4V9U2_9ROSI|nr:hypothetical protein CMV_030451 [Castanea mollissima]